MFVMPFDQRQRYEVVAALVGALGHRAGLRVLDAGGFFRQLDGTSTLPIAEVLPQVEQITIDREAWNVDDGRTSRQPAAPTYVRADAGQLPFAAASFDVVCCLDVLEHVPRERRPVVTTELLRVSRGYVIVAAPVADHGADPAEERLAAFIRSVLHDEQLQLQEHQTFGLPTNDELMALLPSGTQSFGYGNLNRWYALMLAKYHLLALPHNAEAICTLDQGYGTLEGEGDRQPPFYRRFYLAAARPGISLEPLAKVAARYEPVRANPAGPLQDLLPWLFATLTAADAKRLAGERAPLEQRRDQLEQEVRDLRRAVAELTALVKEVEGSRVYKVYQLLRHLGVSGAKE